MVPQWADMVKSQRLRSLAAIVERAARRNERRRAAGMRSGSLRDEVSYVRNWELWRDVPIVLHALHRHLQRLAVWGAARWANVRGRSDSVIGESVPSAEDGVRENAQGEKI